MSNEPKQAENGDRLLCDPWRGARTPEFRKFKRDFKASADALFLHEDDYSVWQAMADADQCGRAQNADALPGPNQAGHANAVRRRKRRQKTAFKIVCWRIRAVAQRSHLLAIAQGQVRAGL